MVCLENGWRMTALLCAVLALAGCGTGGTSAGTGGTSGTSGSDDDAGLGGTGGSNDDAGLGGTGGSDDDSGLGGTGGTSACNATVPTTWDSTHFDTHAATQLALRGQLQALVTRMRLGEDEVPTATVLDDLTTLFEAGNPSLMTAMTSTYAGVVRDVFDLFVPTVGVAFVPGATGGRWCGPTPMPTSGCWNFSAGGADLRQLVDKGAYQSALYHQAYLLRVSENVTEATVDQIAALFGANSSFNIDGTAPNANVHAANYAKGMGYYGIVRGHLIAAKAYAAAGAGCEAELDQSLRSALATWEVSQVARFIYYANAGLNLFASGTVTDAENAEAMHDITEGLGLVYGFKGLPAASRVITDAQIDNLLTLMKLPTVGAATMHLFPIGDADDLSDIQTAFDQLQAIYGFSNEQMVQFKTPTAG